MANEPMSPQAKECPPESKNPARAGVKSLRVAGG